MSGEQPALKTSHARAAEPFPLASDVVVKKLTEEVTELGENVEGMAAVLTQVCGEVQGLREDVGKIAPRVAKLEADAAWKAWVIRVGKAAIPIVAYLLGEHFPGLSKYLPGLLSAAGGGP